jgi:hypothetical protein
MKGSLAFIALVCAVTVGINYSPSTTNAAHAVKKEQAVTYFGEPVILLNEKLKGEYLFVHDEEAMARGEACTYVYEGAAEIPKNLVVSFHCTHAKRSRVAAFTVRTSLIPPNDFEIQEFQFAGSVEAHVVPAFLAPEIPIVAF